MQFLFLTINRLRILAACVEVNMVPAAHKDELIQSALQFMRSITNAYGTDEGMKLYNTIVDTFDKDISQKVFVAMITGEYNFQITINGFKRESDAVQMIKMIRTVDRRRLTLAEAKDMVDYLRNCNPVKLEVDPNKRQAAILDLRSVGFFV